MKKLLIFLVLVGYTSLSYSQNLIQTFTDRCTGATQVFQISMTGPTVVVFYNRTQTFTAADVQSGAFRAWLEETYAWWASLNPCSAAQAESQTAQQTAQQTTSAATQAATAAASAPPPPPPNTSTNATTNTNPPTSGTSANTNNQSTNSTSSSSTESNQSGTGSSSDSGGSTEGGSSDTGGESQETKTEETKTEESKTEEKEVESEESNESSEEKQEEESTEEDSESEDSEESEEEESEEESNDEGKEEEDKDKKKKRNLAPPVIAANLMSMQMLDGTWSTAASFGVTQSSLTGLESYGANAMIWSNFKQFSLALSRTKTHMWSEHEGANYLISQKGTRILSKDENGVRPPDRQNQIHHIGSTSLNYMYIFGTNVITTGYSRVYLGQNENFWQGFAGGYALTSSIILLPESTLLSPAFTFFGTKPVKFKTLPRWSFAPMTAISLTPLQATIINKKVETKWNENFTYIIGTGANFQLTQRFVFNIGVNTVNNTDPVIPTTFAVTIGARFAF